MKRWLVRWRLAGLPIDVEVIAADATEAIARAVSRAFGSRTIFRDDGRGTGSVRMPDVSGRDRCLHPCVSLVAVPMAPGVPA